MKILMFGGAFDPPHKGHISILKKAAEYTDFDKILVIPTGTPTHKKNCVAPFDVRLHMAKLAFEPIGENVQVIDSAKILCRRSQKSTALTAVRTAAKISVYAQQGKNDAPKDAAESIAVPVTNGSRDLYFCVPRKLRNNSDARLFIIQKKRSAKIIALSFP